MGVVSAVGLLLVFSFARSWIWTLLGLIMRSENALMGTSMMVLFPLTFVSNVFVAPETMPTWLQSVVDINPITFLVTAARGLMHGEAVTGEITTVLVISAAPGGGVRAPHHASLPPQDLTVAGGVRGRPETACICGKARHDWTIDLRKHLRATSRLPRRCWLSSSNVLVLPTAEARRSERVISNRSRTSERTTR